MAGRGGGEGGWALLEALVALLLVSLAALSLGGAVYTAARVARRAGEVAAGAAAAQRQLEVLRALPFADPALDPAACNQANPCTWPAAACPGAAPCPWPPATPPWPGGRYHVMTQDGTGAALPAGVRRVVVEAVRPGESAAAAQVIGYVRRP